jgi:hypothetical protein
MDKSQYSNRQNMNSRYSNKYKFKKKISLHIIYSTCISNNNNWYVCTVYSLYNVCCTYNHKIHIPVTYIHEKSKEEINKFTLSFQNRIKFLNQQTTT